MSAHLRVLVRQLFDELLALSLHVPAFLVIAPSIARIKLLITVLGKTVFVVSNCPDRVAHQQILQTPTGAIQIIGVSVLLDIYISWPLIKG